MKLNSYDSHELVKRFEEIQKRVEAGTGVGCSHEEKELTTERWHMERYADDLALKIARKKGIDESHMIKFLCDFQDLIENHQKQYYREDSGRTHPYPWARIRRALQLSKHRVK